MDQKRKTKGLDGKDLMNVGIFTAVYLVVYIIVSCICGMIPVVSILMGCVSSIILGIPMMLYFTKIKTIGMVLITYIVNGVLMALLGLGIYSLIFGIVFALIAELILRAGDYKSINRAVIAFAIACIGANGNTLYWITGSDEFMEKTASSMGTDYLNTILGYFDNWWMLPIVIITTFVGGIIGGLMGKSVLKKHFIRSGLV